MSELRACRSLLVQAFVHLLKLYARPNSEAMAHWRGEAASFLAGARRSFTPSVRQRINLPELYVDALYELESRSDNTGKPLSMPGACHFTLEDVLSAHPDISILFAKLGVALQPGITRR